MLIVDRMGKNISGTGMDSNVLNRARVPGEPEPEGLFVMNVAVLDLTEETHGNATGIGLADFMPARLLAKLDLAWTYMNGLTAGVVGTERIKLPVVLATDRDAILAAIATCGRTENEPVRLARIPVRELMDAATPEDEERVIRPAREVARSVAGVRDIEKIFARRSNRFRRWLRISLDRQSMSPIATIRSVTRAVT